MKTSMNSIKCKARLKLEHILLQEAAEVRGQWKEVADENRNLNRQQAALSEDANRLKERCEALKHAIGKVNLDLAEANAEAKKLSAEIVEVGHPSRSPLRQHARASALMIKLLQHAHCVNGPP